MPLKSVSGIFLSRVKDRVSWWPDSSVTKAGEKSHYHDLFQSSWIRADTILHVPFSSGTLACKQTCIHRSAPSLPVLVEIIGNTRSKEQRCVSKTCSQNPKPWRNAGLIFHLSIS